MSAADIYISQSGAGSQNGSSAGNAYPLTFVNTSGNWGSGSTQIGAGTNVHLVGTITSAVTILGSGSSGNPVTIIFESGASMVSAAWPSTGAISGSGFNFITVDGNNVGSISNTANGTNLANQVNSGGAVFTSCSNVLVKRLAISNLYVRVSGTDSHQGGAGVVFQWSGGASFGNCTVDSCTIHDVMDGVFFGYGPSTTNLAMTNCVCYNVNWGGGCGDGATSTLSGLTVTGNIVYNQTNWDDVVGNTFHHNGFYAFAESGGSITGITMSGNTLGPGMSPTQSSAGLFVSGNCGNVLIYNNLFLSSGSSDCPADGYVFVWISKGSQTGSAVYNNTIFGGGSGVGIDFFAGNGNGTTTYIAKNNLIGNVATSISQFNSGSAAALVCDYNDSYGLNSSQAFSISESGSSSFLTFSGWQSAGQDSNGANAIPSLTGNVPSANDTVAKGKATNLTGTFSTDFNGATRASSGAWDIGAYIALSSGSTSGASKAGRGTGSFAPIFA